MWVFKTFMRMSILKKKNLHTFKSLSVGKRILLKSILFEK